MTNTMQAPARSVGHAIAKKVFKDLENLIIQLYARWQDERDFEDFAEYKKAVEKNLPDGARLVKMTARPFVVTFEAGGNVYQIRVTASLYSLKQIG